MLFYKTLEEQDFLQAFEKKEFELSFQPIMNLKSDNFETLEAFIRWHNPTLGTLPPSLFMNNLDKYNLQECMTDYILNAAVEQIVHHFKSGYGQVGVNVNLTPQEFYNPNTIKQLTEIIKKLPYPEYLGIEISPRILTSYIEENTHDTEYHPDCVPSEMEREFLTKIRTISDEYRKLGVTLALDTTDYIIGSLIRADILGLHVIKINAKSLQRAILTDIKILKEYIQASHDFQIPLIAVGIENQDLFKIASHNGIIYAQGLFLCPPLGFDKINKFNNTFNTDSDYKNKTLELQNSINQLQTEKINFKKDTKNEQASSEIEDTQTQKTNHIHEFKIPKIDSIDALEDMPKEYYTNENYFEAIEAITKNIKQETKKLYVEKDNDKNINQFLLGNRQGFGNHPIFGKK